MNLVFHFIWVSPLLIRILNRFEQGVGILALSGFQIIGSWAEFEQRSQELFWNIQEQVQSSLKGTKELGDESQSTEGSKFMQYCLAKALVSHLKVRHNFFPNKQYWALKKWKKKYTMNSVILHPVNDAQNQFNFAQSHGHCIVKHLPAQKALNHI